MASAINEIGNTFSALIDKIEILDTSDKIHDQTIQHDGDIRQTPEIKTRLEQKNNKTQEETPFKLSSGLADKNDYVQDKKEKLGHRRLFTDGNVTYKRVQTSTLKDSIQLGIQRSVGVLSTKPERDVLMIDFMTVETTTFNSDTSEKKSSNSQFTFKTYAPTAFRHFMDLFGINPVSFASSVCSSPLVELPNPGASGSVFYLTQDDAFIVKTVQHKEAEFLQTLLPGYYLNLNQNPCTLLPKFFGLYCYKCDSKNIRTVVMNNVLPSSLKIHVKYDLKGSTYNRVSSKAERVKGSPTFKDLDFVSHYPKGIFLKPEIYNGLINTIKRDCRVLESFQIMDYSLLLGIHNLDLAKREKLQEDSENHEASLVDINNASNGDGHRVVTRAECNESVQLKPDTLRTPVTLGKSKTLIVDKNRVLQGLPARQANGENLLLFVGIIDILQSYRLKKKLEHVWKSLLYGGTSVSVHNPAFYSRRFQEFVTSSVFRMAPSTPLARRRSATRLKQDDDKPAE